MAIDPSLQDPKELILAAKNGSTAAFGQLYELYFTPVYRFILFRVRNQQEAEDLAQTVFLRVYQSVGNFEERGYSPLTYFFTIARNAVIDHWRKKKAFLDDAEGTLFATIPDNKESAHDAADREHRMEQIRKALPALTEEQQEVITLKFLNGLSNKEISAILNKNEDAVRQLQSRAVKALREILQTYADA